jgi:hypothetical protein
MMHIGFEHNEYQVPVSKHICDTCGTEFTVCPAIRPGRRGWDNCLGRDCDSYEPHRDIDLFLDAGMVGVVKSRRIDESQN